MLLLFTLRGIEADKTSIQKVASKPTLSKGYPQPSVSGLHTCLNRIIKMLYVPVGEGIPCISDSLHAFYILTVLQVVDLWIWGSMHAS